jgi:hypothetical protein
MSRCPPTLWKFLRVESEPVLIAMIEILRPKFSTLIVKSMTCARILWSGMMGKSPSIVGVSHEKLDLVRSDFYTLLR